jgi:hypothetical protein
MKSDGYLSLGGTMIYWGDSNEGQLKLQIQLKENFKRLDEYFKLLEPKMPIEKFEYIKNACRKTDKWINKQGDPPGLSIRSSIENFDDELNILQNFIDELKCSEHEIVIVPDTNAIIKHPNPIDYFKICPNEKFTFLILPTVLSELDNHKNFHKNSEFQTKVSSVIQRLKGYNKQGDIFHGVNIEKGKITIKMIASEPSFDSLPKWFDEKNNDDRIIARILEFQVNNLNSITYLISGDLNMLNKAKLVGLNYFDNDEIG